MKNLLKIIYIIFCFIIIIFIFYFLANCVIQVPEGTFTVFKDKRIGDVKILSPGTHYLLAGLFPERILLRGFKNFNNDIFNLKIKIPALESLNNDALSARMTFNVSYLINSKDIQIPDMSFEKDNNIFNDTIAGNIKANIESELILYFSPSYRPDLIRSETNIIIEKAFTKLSQQSKERGLDIQKFEIIGPIELPSKEIFENELKYLTQLRDIEKNNKKELLILESKLVSEQKENNNYYNKLNEISKLIKQNPDLLKYIYIDKMADNVKVILTSDKSGLPLGLLNENEPGKSSVDGVIDNLNK